MYDSYGYWQLAYNIKEYGIFSQSYSLPLEPDYYRTPVYPLFIIIAESIRVETIPIIVLQLLLGVLTCFYTYKLSHKITQNTFISSLAALIVAIDVPSIVMNNIVMTETLFTFLLIVSVYQFIGYLQTGKTVLLITCAVLIGLTILCRPIGFFVPLFLSLFIFYNHRKEKVIFLKKFFLFGSIVLLILSPWLIRNKIVFDHYFLSVIREHDMQNYQAAAVYADVNNRSLAESQSILRWKTFKNFKGDANKQPYEYAHYIEQDAMDIAFEHPTILLKHHAVQFMHFFLKPCRAYIDIQLGNWGRGYNTIPKDYPIFSYLFKHNSKLTITIVFFQLFLLLLIYLSIFFGFLYFKKEKKIFYLLVIGLLVFCFANLTLPYVTESRFRVPVLPYLAIMAAAGIYWLKEKLKKRKESPKI